MYDFDKETLTLRTDADLFAAALLQREVSIISVMTAKGRTVAQVRYGGGIISGFDRAHVVINGIMYKRRKYEFRAS